MRLILLGSGSFALPTFDRLRRGPEPEAKAQANAEARAKAKAGARAETGQTAHEILAVVSQPDRPAGRKRRLTPTVVADWALDHGLPVHRPENVNDPACIETLRDLDADAALVIAYGQKLSDELIKALAPWVGNLHGSLLPRYRGAAPIQRAMIHGEHETGVCIIAVCSRMDAGDIFGARSTPIDPLEAAGELHDRLAKLGAPLAVDVLEKLRAGTLQGEPQNEAQATQAPKLVKADGFINFDHHAQAVRAWIHGVTPWPGAQVDWLAADAEDPKRIFLRRVRDRPDVEPDAEPGELIADRRVATARGVIELLELQTPGEKIQPIDRFLQRHPLKPGDRFATLRRAES